MSRSNFKCFYKYFIDIGVTVYIVKNVDSTLFLIHNTFLTRYIIIYIIQEMNIFFLNYIIKMKYTNTIVTFKIKILKRNYSKKYIKLISILKVKRYKLPLNIKLKRKYKTK